MKANNTSLTDQYLDFKNSTIQEQQVWSAFTINHADFEELGKLFAKKQCGRIVSPFHPRCTGKMEHAIVHRTPEGGNKPVASYVYFHCQHNHREYVPICLHL